MLEERRYDSASGGCRRALIDGSGAGARNIAAAGACDPGSGYSGTDARAIAAAVTGRCSKRY